MNVAIFTDNDFGKVNGVTTALRAVLRHAPADVSARVYTADDAGCDSPDYLALRSPGIGIPFYPEMRMHWPRVARFLRHAREERIDLVHYTTPGPIGLAALAVAARLRLPLVGSFHTLLAEYTEVLSGSRTLGGAMRAYQRWAYGRCQIVLAPSHATRRVLAHAGFVEDRLRVWTRGVDTERFSPERRSAGQRAAWGARPDRPMVAYVGRLSREKGLAELPAISRALRAHGLDHRLLFVGDGPMRAELEAACPDAVFTGRVGHHHVPALLASADVFCFPSRTDTFGNAVLEAQACGLPALVTDEGGPQEAVRHGETGLVCGPGRPFTFAVGLSCLLRETNRRAQMGAAARRLALERSWPRTLEPLFDAWRDAHRARVDTPRRSRASSPRVTLAAARAAR
jgi:glycosyltransferase involved in cell wall biosynthesis